MNVQIVIVSIVKINDDNGCQGGVGRGFVGNGKVEYLYHNNCDKEIKN